MMDRLGLTFDPVWPWFSLLAIVGLGLCLLGWLAWRTGVSGLGVAIWVVRHLGGVRCWAVPLRWTARSCYPILYWFWVDDSPSQRIGDRAEQSRGITQKIENRLHRAGVRDSLCVVSARSIRARR